MNHRTSHQIQFDTIVNRYSCESNSVEVLADIYQDDVNIAIWQRRLSQDLLTAAEQVLKFDHPIRFSSSITPLDAYDRLYHALGANNNARAISADITDIVDMFCCLFDLKQVGLRLSTLERAMCPKFHVDKVPCRLVTTYSEIATEWLTHHDVDRSKLGIGSQGKTDEKSGIYRSSKNIQRLNCGDIGLLKGESWLGNEGGGLVHRSPILTNGNKRLLLTLDFI